MHTQMSHRVPQTGPMAWFQLIAEIAPGVLCDLVKRWLPLITHHHPSRVYNLLQNKSLNPTSKFISYILEKLQAEKSIAVFVEITKQPKNQEKIFLERIAFQLAEVAIVAIIDSSETYATVCSFMSDSTAQNKATGKELWLTPLRLGFLLPSVVLAWPYHCTCLIPVHACLKNLHNGSKIDLNLIPWAASLFQLPASIVPLH